MIQSVEEMTAAEIDSILAVLWRDQQQNFLWLVNARKYAKQYEARGDKRSAEQSWAQVERYEAKAKEFKEKVRPYEDEFDRRGGWNRYFLVTNNNGHVHRERNCTTCYDSTQYAWLPELSDCDEEAMVEEFGEKACTVCFPNAPAYKAFHGPGRRDAAAKAARDAEKAEKAAAKAEKAITALDGSPLRVDGWVVKTKIAARNELSRMVQNYGWYGPTHPTKWLDEAVKLIEVLDAAGIETAPVIERAAKKVLKEGAQYDIREVLS